LFLEFSDAIYRQGADGQHLYPTFESLRGEIAPEDSFLAGQLATEIRGCLSSEETVVYCPLGIGAHVDHILARNCGEILRTLGSTVVFYRDFYYDRTWGDQVEGSDMNRVNVTLTPQELRKKVLAFSEYKSQILGLFDSQSGMASYFADTGRNESLFLPKQESVTTLAMLWSVVAGRHAAKRFDS
jgi:hypothetical protein